MPVCWAGADASRGWTAFPAIASTHTWDLKGFPLQSGVSRAARPPRGAGRGNKSQPANVLLLNPMPEGREGLKLAQSVQQKAAGGDGWAGTGRGAARAKRRGALALRALALLLAAQSRRH